MYTYTYFQCGADVTTWLMFFVSMRYMKARAVTLVTGTKLT